MIVVRYCDGGREREREQCGGWRVARSHIGDDDSTWR